MKTLIISQETVEAARTFIIELERATRPVQNLPVVAAAIDFGQYGDTGFNRDHF